MGTEWPNIRFCELQSSCDVNITSVQLDCGDSANYIAVRYMCLEGMGNHGLTHWPWVGGWVGWQKCSICNLRTHVPVWRSNTLRVTGLCVGNYQWPVVPPHTQKGPVTWKIFPIDANRHGGGRGVSLSPKVEMIPTLSLVTVDCATTLAIWVYNGT